MEAEIVVPALTLRCPDGQLDVAATARYAERAVSTWVDRFILSGTTDAGHLMSEAQRASVLGLWLDVAEPRRLLPCCWSASDVQAAVERETTPIVVMRNVDGNDDAARFLSSLPVGSYVYSHPAHTPTVLDDRLCSQARDGGYLPAGAKLAKVSHRDIVAVRAQVGRDFSLWDASSRDITASVAAGASGVVTTPLSPFTDPFPPRCAVGLQSRIDVVQAALDTLPSRESRRAYLAARAFSGA